MAALLAAGWMLLPPAAVGANAPAAPRLPGGRDAYFVEDNLVYRRFLELMHDGAYRQINQDRTRCAEVDMGTWDQTADGTVRLHSTHHALRFRALLGGPLNVVLDSQEKLDHLTTLASAIRRFLASTPDGVFAVHTAEEFDVPPGIVTIPESADTFRRADVESLARQITHTVTSSRTGIYMFTPVKPTGSPLLLILQDAVFQPDALFRVRHKHHVPPNAAPPFYFAQVDEDVYARELGTWQTFRFLGGTD